MVDCKEGSGMRDRGKPYSFIKGNQSDNLTNQLITYANADTLLLLSVEDNKLKIMLVYQHPVKTNRRRLICNTLTAYIVLNYIPVCLFCYIYARVKRTGTVLEQFIGYQAN